LDVNSEFSRGGKASNWKLFKGKSTTQIDRVDTTDSAEKSQQPQLSVPLVEALFLPDFPVRTKDSDFDVSSAI
jgi:hypothetical protein